MNKKRWEVLTKWIQEYNYTLGAEVGTGTGRNAMELLNRNSNLRLIQVAYYPGPDVLPGDALHYSACKKARRLWKKRMSKFPGERMQIIRKPSHIACEKVPDGSLDFVFIDADHSYEECLRDIQCWVPKVKKGGLIVGHDLDYPDFPGVRKAVEAYFKNFKKEEDYVWYVWNE